MGTLTIDLMPKRLEERLSEKAPDLEVKRIQSIARSTGGLSSENYWVTAETSKGEEKWVLRMNPPGGVLEPYDVVREYWVTKDFEGTEIPVPKGIYVEEDPEPLGGSYYLMEFIEGEQYVHTDPRFEDEAFKDEVMKNYVKLLAKLHTAPPPEALLPPLEGCSYTKSEALRCKDRLEKIELLPHPLMRYVIDKLVELAPEEGPRVTMHGDYRLANFIWEGTEIIGVLDWERARLGDPLSDIGFSHNEWLHSWCAVKGEYAKLYTELTGFEIEEKRLAYFRLLEHVKAQLVGFSAPAALAQGRNWDLRLFSVASIGMGHEALNINLAHELIQLAG
jgi:aminoglycoside phosphotransferase (APT) family kinase protein